MSSQHKRPFLAFVVLVVVAAAVVGANAFRANADRARFIAAGPIAVHSSVVHGTVPVPGSGTLASAAERRPTPDRESGDRTDGSAKDPSTGSRDASSHPDRPRRGTDEQRSAAHPMAAVIYGAAVSGDREVAAVPAPAAHVDPTVRHTARHDQRWHRSRPDGGWHRADHRGDQHRAEGDHGRQGNRDGSAWHRADDAHATWQTPPRPDRADDTGRPSGHERPEQSRAEHVRDLLADVLDRRGSGGPRSRAARDTDQHR